MCVCEQKNTHTHTPYSLAHVKQEVDVRPSWWNNYERKHYIFILLRLKPSPPIVKFSKKQ